MGLISKQEINSKTYVIVPGEEIEVFNASELKDEIMKLIESGYLKIVMDLRNVEYMDSSGLGVIVSTLKKIKTVNGKLIISSPRSSIKQIFELTSLDKVFNVYETLEEALKDLEE